jgi:hypothetical protein
MISNNKKLGNLIRKSFFSIDRYGRSPFRALMLSSVMIIISLIAQHFFSKEHGFFGVFRTLGLVGCVFFVYTCIGFLMIVIRSSRKDT